MSTNLSTVIAGVKLPLMATEVTKKTTVNGVVTRVGTGKFWHYFRTPDSKAVMFGLKWDALAPQLPTSISIDGHDIDLDVDLQEATYQDRATKKTVVRKERHLQAKANG